MELIKRNRSGYPADLRDAGPVDFPVRIGDGHIDEVREEEKAQVQTKQATEPRLEYQQPSNTSDQTTTLCEPDKPSGKRPSDYADEIMQMAAHGMRPYEIAEALGLRGQQVALYLYRKRQQAKLAEVRQAPRQTAPQATGQVFDAAPIQTPTQPTQDAPSSLAAAVISEADRCAQVLQAVERAYGDGGRDVAVAALLRLQQAVDRLMREVA